MGTFIENRMVVRDDGGAIDVQAIRIRFLKIEDIGLCAQRIDRLKFGDGFQPVPIEC